MEDKKLKSKNFENDQTSAENLEFDSLWPYSIVDRASFTRQELEQILESLVMQLLILRRKNETTNQPDFPTGPINEFLQAIKTFYDVYMARKDELSQSSSRHNDWALALVQGMKEADIEWKNDPDASINSRARYKKHLLEKWQRGQIENPDE